MDERRESWWESPTKDLGKALRLPFPGGFVAERGGRLDEVQVSYESWGELNAAGDNAVLVVHTLTADCHVTGDFADQPVGWWEGLFGPGRAIDTNRHFVVCPNLLGSCYGSTGPRFPGPDGEPLLERFPLLTPRDLMRVQREFVKALGIRRLRMVIGPSLGGMIAWEWAIEAGEDVDLVAVVAAPLRTTPYQIGLNWLQRRGVELDISGHAAAAWGQMMSRGVGMLSYRTPVSLDEKFGREWFKAPGSTLGDRGMFNVESWLRYQGQKMVKRFDPWSYVLLTRAMDLHDVGEGRGGLVSALEKVRCRTLVVGISSDDLYPAAEVHLGADILNHLGKPVEYAEIRTPHGHDGFLVENVQMGAILAEPHARRPRMVPTPAERETRHVRLGILGAGRVTNLFLSLLRERESQLAAEYALRFTVTAVADIDPRRRLGAVYSDVPLGHDPEALVNRDDVDVVIEATRGSDTRSLIAAALMKHRPVATVNKVMIRRHGAELERLALQHGVRLAWHNSLAAGWPLLYAVERPLVREQFQSISAVLSATCNVILERMEKGYSFDAALSQATALEITEQDPDLDVSGWDTAQKLSILIARTLGLRFGVEQIPMRGIADLDPVLVREAPRVGLRVKLVALYERREATPVAGVFPLAVPMDGHLGGVRGSDNVIVLSGEDTGELVHLGSGGGKLPVANALLNDLVGLFHPSHSWTGRFPPAGFAPSAPVFATNLIRERGTAVLSDREEPGALPVLGSIRR